MYKFEIIFIKRIENLVGGGMLISKDIGSLSVTSFSSSYLLEMRKYGVMP